ncbi:MAG TPA: hydroxyacid dehydrogenase [Patescibacteria group bacterium]|nr:hydroxyacid dehydrogenase [Patescibacteria group bacterium]
MKIAIYETQPWEREYLSSRLAGQEAVFPAAGEEAAPDTEVICNFLDFRVDAETLNKFPKLKLVATRSTGFDHIDLAACAAKGVAVCNVPTYGENTVAEFAFALLLALSRKLYPALKRVKEEGLFSTDGLQGFDLKGRTLSVIGTGHIGTCVVQIAKGFGMTVLAYDPYPRPDLAAQYGFTYKDLDAVLGEADAVTLHVPYMPQTHHLINAEKLKLFKPGSVLINTARGGLVDTDALAAALESGTGLAGAALDVLEEEGFIKDEIHLLAQSHPNEQELKTALADHRLMQMPNVLVTPHNAFNTKEAVMRILDTTVQNIVSFSQDKPINLVKS